jgi:hypothetical protein
MYLDDLVSKGAVAPQNEPEKQAQHSAAPTAGVGEDAKSVVIALFGFMVFFYMLHVVERWAVKA